MAKLFANKKTELTEVKLSFETVYLKEVSFKHVPALEKASDPATDEINRIVQFAKVIKEILVDKDGNPYEDLKDMTPNEMGDMFSIKDFGKLIEAAMPPPADGDEPAGKG